MNLGQIKQAVRDGQIVCHQNENYRVVLHTFKNGDEQWLIKCLSNDYCIGLTWQDEVTMNGYEQDFFILHQDQGKDEIYILENREAQDELLSTMIKFLYGWEADNEGVRSSVKDHLNQHCDVVQVFWFNNVDGDAQEELASEGRNTPMTFKEAFQELQAAYENIIFN
jgi:hypothetical protein